MLFVAASKQTDIFTVSWTIIERRMVGVRLVTLDMVGTVLRFSRPPVAQYQEVAARHGHSLRLEELSASFKQRWTDMNQDFPHFGSTTPGLSSIRWWHQLVKVTRRVEHSDNWLAPSLL